MSSNYGIAISGRSGCGNTTVSKLLAKKLGFTLVNYTFRTMAAEMGIEFEELRRLAEQSDEYDRQLDRNQLALAQKNNCVLGSRLAVWLYKDADLKVYLKASPRVRSDRVFKREGGDREVTFRNTEARDAADQARYLRIYDIDTADYSHVDLVINVENYLPDQIANIILCAFNERRSSGS